MEAVSYIYFYFVLCRGMPHGHSLLLRRKAIEAHLQVIVWLDMCNTVLHDVACHILRMTKQPQCMGHHKFNCLSVAMVQWTRHLIMTRWSGRRTWSKQTLGCCIRNKSSQAKWMTYQRKKWLPSRSGIRLVVLKGAAIDEALYLICVM